MNFQNYTASRYHDISCGHRVVGHEGKCRYLHGHNYRVTFHCRAIQDVQQYTDDRLVRELSTDLPINTELDHIGRVIDFGVIKERLCMWLEENWDHKFIAWDTDQHIKALQRAIDPATPLTSFFGESMVFVPFNPTAENMAHYLVEVIGPKQLRGTGVELYKVDIEETRKCSACYERKVKDDE
jgi:6-pyruvoyltetrahydropterin/6-carboxytetrahydropterin synthase